MADILMLLPWDMFPVNNGAAMRFYDTSSSVAARDRVVVYAPPFKLLEYRGAGYVPDKLKFKYEHLRMLPDRIIEKLPHNNFFIRSLIYFRPWSWLGLALKNKKPDVIHAEHVFTFVNAYMLKIIWRRPLVLVLHNVEYLLIEELYGRTAGRLSYYLVKYAVKHSDVAVCVSERDGEVVRREFKADNVDVVPNGINLERYLGPIDLLEKIRLREKLGLKGDERVILFHGLLSYPPNIDAVEALIHHIMPGVREKIRNAVLVIVGPNPPAYPPMDGIIFIGAVEDIAPYIDIADVCVVPITKGSGSRLKVMEYMASRKAIVATRKGVEGIDLEDGTDVLLADDWPAFYRNIIFLLGDEKLRNRLGTNARILLEKKYCWDSLSMTYTSIYKRLAERNMNVH